MRDELTKGKDGAREADVGNIRYIENHRDPKKGVIYDMCDRQGMITSKQERDVKVQLLLNFHDNHLELSRFREVMR